jgi:ArsR family transcriptional regulator
MLNSLPLIRERGACCPLPVTLDAAWAGEQASLLKAIADPTRIAMLAALQKAEQPICICDFTGALGLSQPTISHHIAKLRAAGLVESERSGIWVYYRLRADLPERMTRVLGALLG